MRIEGIPSLEQRKPLAQWIQQLDSLEISGILEMKQLSKIMEVSMYQLSTIRKALRDMQKDAGIEPKKINKSEYIRKSRSKITEGKWGQIGKGTDAQRCMVYNGKLPPCTDEDYEEMRADRAGVAVGLNRSESIFTSETGVIR
jgi:hypothetical protein